MGNGLWAITSYFNPAGYRRRRWNYRVFRERLRVPLVTVELSYTGGYELKPGDAEILVQLQGSDVMWQKERLLNVALAHLPAECRNVAWLDCDIVFGRADWVEAASAALETFPLCQLYSAVHHLAPDPPAMDKEYSLASHPAFARAVAEGLDAHPGCVVQSGEYKRGHAWAANRALLDGAGFYDRCVIGAGDRFLAFAAIGLQEEVLAHTRCSAAHAADYRGWARAFHRAVDGRVGGIDADLFHLWHGSLDARQYEPRHAILAEHGYDPRADIAVDGQGCWRWNSPKHEMHRRVREYFYDRNEDGAGEREERLLA